MNEELFQLKQPETFPAIEAAEKIVVSIDRSNGEDKTACIVAALDAVGKAAILAVKVFSEAVSTVQAYTETLLSVYPNKRVLHLAKYNPKERVRKKNTRRVLKWIERGFEMVGIIKTAIIVAGVVAIVYIAYKNKK